MTSIVDPEERAKTLQVVLVHDLLGIHDSHRQCHVLWVGQLHDVLLFESKSAKTGTCHLDIILGLREICKSLFALNLSQLFIGLTPDHKSDLAVNCEEPGRWDAEDEFLLGLHHGEFLLRK